MTDGATGAVITLGICHKVVFPFSLDNWFLNIYDHATGWFRRCQRYLSLSHRAWLPLELWKYLKSWINISWSVSVWPQWGSLTSTLTLEFNTTSSISKWWSSGLRKRNYLAASQSRQAGDLRLHTGSGPSCCLKDSILLAVWLWSLDITHSRLVLKLADPSVLICLAPSLAMTVSQLPIYVWIRLFSLLSGWVPSLEVVSVAHQHREWHNR